MRYQLNVKFFNATGLLIYDFIVQYARNLLQNLLYATDDF